MFRCLYCFALSLFTFTCSLGAADFSVCSYNCGGLTDHYDYIRALSMQKLMQKRYDAEPEEMALLEKIQQTALTILFSPYSIEREYAQKRWEKKNYSTLLHKLTSDPQDPKSLNKSWHDQSESIVTSYKIRPVEIYDEEICTILEEHLEDLVHASASSPCLSLNEKLSIVRTRMANRIFKHQLKYDIIALQEADYITPSSIPPGYAYLFSDSPHSTNALIWNQNRFELLDEIANSGSRFFVVKLRELSSGKTLLVATAHLTGCNPFRMVINTKTAVPDSLKGDEELKVLLSIMEAHEADYKIIAMDSNVTATHPRLALLKQSGYQLDYKRFLEPTCTNPSQVLDTHIDWIALKTDQQRCRLSNIPVRGIGLNSPQTNISDHKPVAALIRT